MSVNLVKTTADYTDGFGNNRCWQSRAFNKLKAFFRLEIKLDMTNLSSLFNIFRHFLSKDNP